MTPYQPRRVSGGKLASGIILAILIGALTPVFTLLEMSFLIPVALLSGIFMVFLFCYAGQLPAWIYMIVQLSTTGVLLSGHFVLMVLAAGTAPALVCIWLIMRKTAFFDQMKIAIAAYLGGMLIAVTIAYYSFGGNMIERMAEALKGQFDLMPDAFFTPFVDMVNSALSTGAPGVKPLTVASYRTQLGGILNLMSEVYQESLPGCLLSGAALSGVLSTLWGNWIWARRGLATSESYVGPTRWFLPRSATLGLTLMWVAAYLLAQTQYAQGKTIYFTVYSLASLAFLIQALGAIDRFLYRRGAPDRRRRVLLVVALIFGTALQLFNTILFVIGVGSALFGSHGAFRRPLPRDNDDDTQN